MGSTEQCFYDLDKQPIGKSLTLCNQQKMLRCLQNLIDLSYSNVYIFILFIFFFLFTHHQAMLITSQVNLCYLEC